MPATSYSSLGDFTSPSTSPETRLLTRMGQLKHLCGVLRIPPTHRSLASLRHVDRRPNSRIAIDSSLAGRLRTPKHQTHKPGATAKSQAVQPWSTPSACTAWRYNACSSHHTLPYPRHQLEDHYPRSTMCKRQGREGLEVEGCVGCREMWLGLHVPAILNTLHFILLDWNLVWLQARRSVLCIVSHQLLALFSLWLLLFLALRVPMPFELLLVQVFILLVSSRCASCC
ncbi:hypothetical protein MKEN_00838900 [Mycena kentingensis (nom. inval.)]|nr:hypothetical protein MKEN_00838900 [Mycena kentingensis (nom. inval.)]